MMSLALRLGYAEPSKMLEEMSSSAFSDWLDFYKISPFDDSRFDVGPAVVASTIANVNRKKHTPPFKISDFLPFEKLRKAPPKINPKSWFMHHFGHRVKKKQE